MCDPIASASAMLRSCRRSAVIELRGRGAARQVHRHVDALDSNRPVRGQPSNPTQLTRACPPLRRALLIQRSTNPKRRPADRLARPSAGLGCGSAHGRACIIRRMRIFGFGQTRLGVPCGSRIADRGAFNTNAAQPGARADPLRQAAPGRFRVLRPFSFRGQSRPASAGSSALR